MHDDRPDLLGQMPMLRKVRVDSQTREQIPQERERSYLAPIPGAHSSTNHAEKSMKARYGRAIDRANLNSDSRAME